MTAVFLKTFLFGWNIQGTRDRNHELRLLIFVKPHYCRVKLRSNMLNLPPFFTKNLQNSSGTQLRGEESES